MIGRLFRLSLSAVVLLAIAAPLALAGAGLALATDAPTSAPPATFAAAAQAPRDPAQTRVAAQEGDEIEQFNERNTGTDNEWIVIGVALLVVLIILGFGLAAFGMSAE